MIITLNEYTLALLCGGVSCLTYILIHFNDIEQNKLTKKTINKSENSDGDKIPNANDLNSRRQSQLAARFRSNRAESVKNDHVVFADEFNDQDLKFAPVIDTEEPEVEGILQNTDGGVDIDTIEDLDAPPLNTFDKSQPLDDLLIRRRSLHSSPAHSRSGSRSGSLRASNGEDLGSDDEENAVVDAQDLQLKSLKSEIAGLRTDLANMREKESKMAKDKEHLKEVLDAALAKLYPERFDNLTNINFNCLNTYLTESSM